MHKTLKRYAYRWVYGLQFLCNFVAETRDATGMQGIFRYHDQSKKDETTR